jgi:hypothetical protein
MVFNATFNNISVISWLSVLLVEETGVPGENHLPVASHWQTLSHNVLWSTPRLSRIWTHNFSDDTHHVWKEDLNSNCEKFYQYQQNKQSTLNWNHWIQKKHDIWCWKFRYWLVTGAKIWLPRLNQIMRSPLSDNWISNNNTDINKQLNTCTDLILFMHF